MAVPGKQDTKSKVKTMGNEGGDCTVKFREPCPPNTCPVPEEGPPEGRPPDRVPAVGKAPATSEYGASVLKWLSGFKNDVIDALQSLRRISHYSAAPEDALIAYPSMTVTIATPVKPGNPEIIATAGAAGYDRVFIFFNGQRVSDKVWLINDGPGSLFVIASYNLTKWSGEDEIKPGEFRAFTSVYELRLRSPTAGTTYRVTEYEPDPADAVVRRVSPTGAAINIAANGVNTIIAAPGAGLRIKIVKMFFVCTGAVAITFRSDANDLTGAMSFAANGGLGLDTDIYPMEMNANEAFIMFLGGAVQVSGRVLYITEA